MLGLGEIPLSVLVEIISDAFAILKDQAAIHDLKGVHVNFHEFVPGNAVGAVAAENRFVFGGLFIEEVFVFLRGKEVGSAVMPARELCPTFDGLMVVEERNRIVALFGSVPGLTIQALPPKLTKSSSSSRSAQVLTSSRVLVNLATDSAKNCSVSASLSGPRRSM